MKILNNELKFIIKFINTLKLKILVTHSLQTHVCKNIKINTTKRMRKINKYYSRSVPHCWNSSISS